MRMYADLLYLYESAFTSSPQVPDISIYPFVGEPNAGEVYGESSLLTRFCVVEQQRVSKFRENEHDRII